MKYYAWWILVIVPIALLVIVPTALLVCVIADVLSVIFNRKKEGKHLERKQNRYTVFTVKAWGNGEEPVVEVFLGKEDADNFATFLNRFHENVKVEEGAICGRFISKFDWKNGDLKNEE